MPFLSRHPEFGTEHPLFCSILANTMLSTVPGISGAGPTPEKTLLTPVLDSELVVFGEIRSRPVRPNTPTGCPTPAAITRAMMELTGVLPVFVNAGLAEPPVVPCIDVYSEPGRDPRTADAVPDAGTLFGRGEWCGRFLSRAGDLLVLGECVPGGTTTALCVLRALGYEARVSSSFPQNPTGVKEEVCRVVMDRLAGRTGMGPLDIVRAAGDPMMAVAAGICSGFSGTVLLAGGTQMCAVGAVLHAMDRPVPEMVTTCYVREDPSANIEEVAAAIGIRVYYVDPGFGSLGHSGLARYCIGEVKEGMGAGGAMFLARILGFSPDEIRAAVLRTVQAYC
jgi:uncharacterized protein (TIGR00303 family)